MRWRCSFRGRKRARGIPRRANKPLPAGIFFGPRCRPKQAQLPPARSPSTSGEQPEATEGDEREQAVDGAPTLHAAAAASVVAGAGSVAGAAPGARVRSARAGATIQTSTTAGARTITATADPTTTDAAHDREGAGGVEGGDGGCPPNGCIDRVAASTSATVAPLTGWGVAAHPVSAGNRWQVDGWSTDAEVTPRNGDLPSSPRTRGTRGRPRARALRTRRRSPLPTIRRPYAPPRCRP